MTGQLSSIPTAHPTLGGQSEGSLSQVDNPLSILTPGIQSNFPPKPSLSAHDETYTEPVYTTQITPQSLPIEFHKISHHNIIQGIISQKDTQKL